MVSAIALLVAVPVGLMIAIYLAEYASPWFRSWAKPTIEVLRVFQQLFMVYLP